jgi:hypothetical protein
MCRGYIELTKAKTCCMIGVLRSSSFPTCLQLLVVGSDDGVVEERYRFMGSLQLVSRLSSLVVRLLRA